MNSPPRSFPWSTGSIAYNCFAILLVDIGRDDVNDDSKKRRDVAPLLRLLRGTGNIVFGPNCGLLVSTVNVLGLLPGGLSLYGTGGSYNPRVVGSSPWSPSITSTS